MALVVLVFVYWLMGDEAPTIVELPAELVTEPDAVIKRASYQRFDADGELQFEISATDAILNESREMSELKDIAIKVVSDPKDAWEARAENGEFSNADAERVLRLFGEVSLSLEDTGGRTTQFQTEELSFYLDQELIQSNKTVSIDDNLSKIRADTIEIDLKERSLRLEGNPESQVEFILWSDS